MLAVQPAHWKVAGSSLIEKLAHEEKKARRFCIPSIHHNVKMTDKVELHESYGKVPLVTAKALQHIATVLCRSCQALVW